jgi:DeoR/GlpR family transcriptional regulator of sugar metabolism
MNVRERRESIAERLRLEGEATIADLAARYGTSEMTIRRDLDALEVEGLVRRARRGAVSVESRAFEPPVVQRAAERAAAKARIGAAAAAILSPGETVSIDVGTTALAMVRALPVDLELTVVTPSLLVATELAAHDRVRIYVTGGEVRHGELSLVGPQAAATYQTLRCDVAVLGIAGVDLAGGLSEYNADDAFVKRAALASARRTIVLADAVKLGRVAFAHVAALDQVDLLVTDASPEHPVVVGARERGVDVLTVEPFTDQEV